ncbi:MAG: Mov34/MPN/PAD-1 family protein [Desulfurococcaceae archaeon]
MITLEICESIIDKIIKEAKTSEIEKVYIGVGVVESGHYIVKEVFECNNIAENPRVRFVIDPVCIYNAFTKAEARNMRITLLIHSHPAPPDPSELDIDGMKSSGLPWLIVDMNNGMYAAWIIREGNLYKVYVDILDC